MDCALNSYNSDGLYGLYILYLKGRLMTYVSLILFIVEDWIGDDFVHYMKYWGRFIRLFEGVTGRNV